MAKTGSAYVEKSVTAAKTLAAHLLRDLAANATLHTAGHHQGPARQLLPPYLCGTGKWSYSVFKTVVDSQEGTHSCPSTAQLV